MYDKERGLYIAHCAKGALSITGKIWTLTDEIKELQPLKQALTEMKDYLS